VFYMFHMFVGDGRKCIRELKVLGLLLVLMCGVKFDFYFFIIFSFENIILPYLMVYSLLYISLFFPQSIIQAFLFFHFFLIIFSLFNELYFHNCCFEP
jgi:hypothetical protein